MQYLTGRLKRKLARRIQRASHAFLFLDYDGTLTPIMPTPEMAKLQPSMRKILIRLAKTPNLSIGIITGRKLEDIETLVKLKDMIYGGNHGLEIESPKFRYTHPHARGFERVAREIVQALNPLLRGFPGSFIEDKSLALAVHYRLVDEKLTPALRAELFKRVAPWTESKGIVLMEAKKNVELRPNINWNKGSAVRWILMHEEPESLPIYIGDDRTDEHAFRAIGDRGITIRVGYEKQSIAQYFVEDTSDVQSLLSFLSVVKNERSLEAKK